MRSRSRWVLLTLVGCAALSGCSTVFKTKKASEEVNRGADPSRFKAVVVIAGNDARSDLRMSVMVRNELNEAGVTALKRAGRWGSENDAINDICPRGQAVSVDGILFVYYNQLTLVDCQTHVRAYEVNGGDEAGLPGMTKRLVAFLRSGSAPPADSAAKQ